MTTEVTATLGGLGDVEEAMGVMREAFNPAYGEAWSQAQLSGLLIMPGSYLIVARIEGRVAGFALAKSLLDEAELMLLAVAPNYRGRGIGRFLIDKVISESRTRNVSRIFLEMRSDNEEALGLYGGAGFLPVGHRSGYYRGNDGIIRDAITMALSLN